MTSDNFNAPLPMQAKFSEDSQNAPMNNINLALIRPSLTPFTNPIGGYNPINQNMSVHVNAWQDPMVRKTMMEHHSSEQLAHAPTLLNGVPVTTQHGL